MCKQALIICVAVILLSAIGSISFAGDTTAPTISSVSVSPEISAAGDMIYVTVRAQDDTGLSSVTADSMPLQLVNDAWQGYITASSTKGLHNVTVIATDTSGDTSSNTESCYKTLPIVGISNSGATSETARSSASRFLFKVWGRATYVDENYFDIEDGSDNPLRVLEPDHIVRTGDFVIARGLLKYTNNDVHLEASDYDIAQFADECKITSDIVKTGYHLVRSASANLTNPATTESPITVKLISLDPGRVPNVKRKTISSMVFRFLLLRGSECRFGREFELNLAISADIASSKSRERALSY